MRLLLVFLVLVGVSGTSEISDYKDWLKYVGQVNSWGGYQDYDNKEYPLDTWKGYDYQDQYWGKDRDYYEYDRYDKVNNWGYEAQKYEDGPRDYIFFYNEHGRGNDKDDKKYRQEKKRERDSYRTYEYYNDRNEYYDKDRYEDRYDKKDRYGNINLVGLGKNDREDIIRPCALDDWQCIRKYFAKNSKCSIKNGPAPDPLYLKRITIYYPNFNLTQILIRLRITGLGSIKISEFYVNKDTGNLVLALDFKNLNETTPKAFYRYKRTAKESIVLEDFTTIEFRSGTFTAVIPKIPHLQLELAEIHADIDDANPKLYIGPEASNSKDPDVIKAFAAFKANLPTAIQEAFLLKSQLLTAIYIQENICDFGLKLISV